MIAATTSTARASRLVAGSNAAGVLFLDSSEDGGGGLKAMLGAGGYAFAPAESGGGHTLSRGMVTQPVPADGLAAGVLKLCSK